VHVTVQGGADKAEHTTQKEHRRTASTWMSICMHHRMQSRRREKRRVWTRQVRLPIPTQRHRTPQHFSSLLAARIDVTLRALPAFLRVIACVGVLSCRRRLPCPALVTPVSPRPDQPGSEDKPGRDIVRRHRTPAFECRCGMDV
jgi:hypothetical protein